MILFVMLYASTAIKTKEFINIHVIRDIGIFIIVLN